MFLFFFTVRWIFMCCVIWKSYSGVTVEAGGGSFSIACLRRFFTWILLLDWKLTPLRKMKLLCISFSFFCAIFHYPPEHQFLMQPYTCKWLAIIHAINLKNSLKMNVKCSRFHRYGDEERKSRDDRVFLLQCQLVYNVKGKKRIHSFSSWDSFSISQVLHGIFSATTNSKLVLFILLAWISLQRETALSTTPLCSLTSQTHLLMDERDSWDSLIRLI